jgi:proline iminopeptidase
MRRLLIVFSFLLATSLNAQQFAKSGDGVRLWYTESGQGSPVIVIHGGPGMDHDSLAADLAPLRQHHRVIEYDQRGGGRSTLPGDATLLTIEHHVNDLEALRLHLGLKRVTLLAHSFGPAIAARYAIRYPEKIERMIFLSPIPPVKGKFFEEYGASLTARLTAAQRKRGAELQKAFEGSSNITTACREYWSIMTPPRLAKGTSVSVVKSDLCAAPPEAIRFGMTKTNPATFGSLGDWNWTTELARVKAPVLIIHGEEDSIPMAMVSKWVTALPNARILRLPHTGHFPHAEQPAIVFPAIEAFLGGGWPKDAAAK